MSCSARDAALQPASGGGQNSWMPQFGSCGTAKPWRGLKWGCVWDTLCPVAVTAHGVPTVLVTKSSPFVWLWHILVSVWKFVLW